MKKIGLIVIVSFLLFACGSYRYLNLEQLKTGMSKGEVEYLIGPPDRILAVNHKKDGLQEVLEYRTSRDEVYALEFWNNFLTGYEFLYDDVSYIPPVMPPAIFPPYGRPIFVHPPHYHPDHSNRPNRPSRPDQPGRPDRPNRPNRPERPDRPGSGSSSRPDSSRPSRPENTRPNVTKPVETERPVTRPPAGSRSDRYKSNDEKKREGN